MCKIERDPEGCRTELCRRAHPVSPVTRSLHGQCKLACHASCTSKAGAQLSRRPHIEEATTWHRQFSRDSPICLCVTSHFCQGQDRDHTVYVTVSFLSGADCLRQVRATRLASGPFGRRPVRRRFGDGNDWNAPVSAGWIVSVWWRSTMDCGPPPTVGPHGKRGPVLMDHRLLIYRRPRSEGVQR